MIAVPEIRHPASAALRATAPAHGIDRAIGRFADLLYKPKGWAID